MLKWEKKKEGEVSPTAYGRDDILREEGEKKRNLIFRRLAAQEGGESSPIAQGRKSICSFGKKQ